MRSLFTALGLTALALSAGAAPETACPADVEQQLHDMANAIRSGAQTEPSPIAELAEWAITACPDRSHAQALAATLLSAVIPATQDHDEMQRYLDLAETAIRQNDYSWTPKLGPAILRNSDGSTVNYFGYSHATGVLTNTVLPYAEALAERGTAPRAFSGTPYETCPYADHSGSRLGDEARLWDSSVQGKSDKPVFTQAETRLKMLHASCPAHRRDLEYYLARLYGQEVERLAHWNHNYMEELRGYGHDGWFWSNGSVPETIRSESKMKEVKSGLDARARPLAEKGKPYLKAFFAHSPTGKSPDYERRMEAEDWEKYIDKLAP